MDKDKKARAKILRNVCKLCKHKYMKTRDFPPRLSRKCKRNNFKSMREVKWKAGVIDDTVWEYKSFLKHIWESRQKKDRGDGQWSPCERYWAKFHCGSIRRAEFEAGVIIDPRARERHKTKRAITKEEMINWIVKRPGLKTHGWSSSRIYYATLYFKSPRGARIVAGVLENERRKPRPPRHFKKLF